MKNECELKKFKTCAVYPRVRLFLIYTTIGFFKTFSSLPLCVLKYSVFFKKKKKKLTLWWISCISINPQFFFFFGKNTKAIINFTIEAFKLKQIWFMTLSKKKKKDSWHFNKILVLRNHFNKIINEYLNYLGSKIYSVSNITLMRNIWYIRT